jgi:hypothetical protein
MFFLKVKEMLVNLCNSIFSLYLAYIYVIKYQKQGLLHMYLLLFVITKYDSLKIVNKVICAKLLNLF